MFTALMFTLLYNMVDNLSNIMDKTIDIKCLILKYNIKTYREELKMTQLELSQKAGISRSIISGLESGTITVTTTETLSKIAKALGKKVSDIFFD